MNKREEETRIPSYNVVKKEVFSYHPSISKAMNKP